MAETLRVGVDTGGTFTDIILCRQGEVSIKKVPSQPKSPELAIVEGLKSIALRGERGDIVHGTTIATNALLSRTGPRTALVTTLGFEDVLEIGRQNRPALYELAVKKPPTLVPRELIFGLDERVLYTGEVLKPLTDAALAQLVKKLRSAAVESVAVCLLFSYVNPNHEQRAQQALARLGLHVSTSSDVLPAYREYERFSTTVVNAYVAPAITEYLERLSCALSGWHIKMMQSNGGSISLSAACKRPVATILSGPAGGAIAAQKTASRVGEPNIISLDMGGTSTDVSLAAGGLTWSTKTTISGCPIAIPVIDIHTVGAGGGSIAYFDLGGALRVGPTSAGADPGPACYGKGVLPTVTDANIVLGRLSPHWFLGGEFEIQPDRAHRAIADLADRMDISVEAAAEGIVRVANATMQRALSVVSVQRGFDPREFAIVAFGGAGPTHACDLCRAVSAKCVIVPRDPGILSAVGMLEADVVRDYKKSVLMPATDENLPRLRRELYELELKAQKDLAADGIDPKLIRLERRVEMRYVGQSYEIDIPFSASYIEAFDKSYMQEYGYVQEQNATEVVNIRVIAIVPTETDATLIHDKIWASGNAVLGTQRIIEGGERMDATLYQRDRLELGAVLPGPAVIVEYSATTYLPSDFSCKVDRLGNLRLTWRA